MRANLSNDDHPLISRRTLFAAAFAAPAITAVLAACGDATRVTDPPGGNQPNPDPTVPTTGSSASPGWPTAHPTGANEVVVRVGFVGGFVPAGYAFTNLPTLLVSGDGRLITPGVVAAIYPGPLLPALNERTITETGIQKLLAAAGAAGLLKPPPDYGAQILVADAPDTLVVIRANGETYTHQAAALGFETVNESDARKALGAFVGRLDDVASVVGGENLGPQAPLVADRYRIQAQPAGAGELAGDQQKPTLVAWPLASGGVALADAAECAGIGAAEVGGLFESATGNTLFTDAGVVYRVSAVAMLPGDAC